MTSLLASMELGTKTSAEPEFRLVMPSRAEHVALVRQALSAAVDVLDLGESRLLDINAAVSEACNNVVVHAYADGEGPLEVYLCIQESELEVIVSDEGVGIRPKTPEPGLALQGLGLSLIQTLCDRAEFVGGIGEGTKVRMAFSFEDVTGEWTALHRAAATEARPPPGELVVAVSAGPLAAPVLGRVIGLLAARANFSLEGISEAQLVTDSLAAHAPREIVGDKIQLGVDRPDDGLVIRVGPLAEGGAERILGVSALGDLPPVLERLTKSHEVEDHESGELLSLTLAGSN
jgi:serine/threonine-protein kinase RsbW